MTPRRPIGKRLRFRVLARAGFRCEYCGARADERKLHVDHRLPVSRGGTNEETNLVAACDMCNLGKANIVIGVTFLAWLRAQRLRDDIVGDLADDEARSPLAEVTTYKELAAQMRTKRACLDAKCAAWHAWREFRRGGRPTRVVRDHQIDLAMRIAQHGVCVHLKRGTWINGEFYEHRENVA